MKAHEMIEQAVKRQMHDREHRNGKGLVYVPRGILNKLRLYQQIGERSGITKEEYDSWIDYIKICRRYGTRGMFW
jgi:hypothetical protein